MLLNPTTSLLLLIDVQVRLEAAMPKDDPMLRNSSIMIKAAREVGVPIIASEQYPKGLGPTVPELAELLGDGERHEKVEFSCMRNAGLAKAIEASGRSQIVLGGIEAHVCVLQTALELASEHRQVYVIADAVASRDPRSREIALKRMADAGVVIVTTEMAVFEWVGSASSPQFKAISALIR